VTEEGGDLTLVEVQVQVLDGHLAVGVDLVQVLDGDPQRKMCRLSFALVTCPFHLHISLKCDGVGVASKPIAGGEEEVGWLGNTVLARPHCFDVPHDQTVENRVKEQHAHATRHGEGVPCQRAHPNIVPLGPNTHLLVEREVGTTEAKGDVRNQTRDNLCIGVQAFLPHHHKAIRQVEAEEYYPPSCCSNVGP